MAELVGEAYVRIHADTRPMKRELRREMQDAGDEAGEDFSDRLSQTAAARLKANRQRLANALVDRNLNVYRKQFGSIEEAVRRVNEELHDLRERGFIQLNDLRMSEAIVRDWEKLARHTDDYNEALVQARRLNQDIESQAREADQRQAARLRDLRQMVRDAAREVERDIQTQDRLEQDRIRRLADAVNEQYDRRIRLERRLLEEQAHSENTAMDRRAEAWRRMLDQAYKDDEKFVRKRSELYDRAHWENLQRIKKEREEWEKVLDSRFHAERYLSRMSRGLANMSHRGGVASTLLLALPRAILGFSRLVTFFAKPLDEFGKGMMRTGREAGGLLGRLSTLGGVFLRLGPPVIGALAGIVLFGKGLGVLASAVSLSAGLLTTWAGALTNAVGGALVAATPLVLTFGASIFLITRAFKNLTDAQKAALKPLEDLRDEMDEALGRNIADRWIESFREMAPTLRNTVLPAIDDVSKGIGNWGDSFKRALESTATQNFLREFKEHMPNAMTRMGNGLSQLTAGLMGFFAPVMPFAERLAEKFDEMATRFREWTETPEGVQSITTWMERATTAAGHLWRSLGNIATAIWNVFQIGGDEENNFLARLERITGEFEKWTESEQGREDIKQWFKDAEEFGRNLWDILKEISGIFDDLDSEEARQDLEDFGETAQSVAEDVRAIVGAVREVVDAYDWFSATIGRFEDSNFGGDAIESGIEGFLQRSYDSFYQAGQDIRVVWDGLWAGLSEEWNGWWPGFQADLEGFGATVVLWFERLPERIGAALSSLWDTITQPFRDAYNEIVGNSIVPDLVTEVVRLLAGLPGRIVTALAGVLGAVTSPFVQAYHAAVQQGGSIASGVARAMEKAPGLVSKALGGVAGAVEDALREAWRKAVEWGGKIAGAISTALNKAKMKADSADFPGLPLMASGGITSGPAIAGEAGREAVVPLDRPLSQIDPAVRALAAIAQGKSYMARGGVAGSSKSVTVMPGAIQLVSPLSDPLLVARSALDEIAVLAR